MIKDYDIRKFDEIDSTNDYLQRLLYSNECNNSKKYLVISKCQTNGHGSKGRIFLSDRDKGIYFSLMLFYDKLTLKDRNIDINDFITFLTPNVSVCIKQYFKEIFKKDLCIKWVNDLYYNNKKVVGILCKHFPDKNAIIIGIGIDLYKNEHLPIELKDIVGYIFDDKLDDNDINSLIMSIVDNIINNLYIGKINKNYFEDNLVIDKLVKINDKVGKIISINNKGHLIVDIDNNVQEIYITDVEVLM